jgi:glyoxylase-like metal-dependent hydrolase (beta-lactamase superfamily II)
MTEAARRREVGRGERVLPGVWRLRLPLPWPGVPHCNAWALAAGDGVVLVDTGIHEPGSMAQLERAMAQVRLKVEHVRLLVLTHAHVDHCGQAQTIAERAGCEVWMHPDHEHLRSQLDDPDEALRRIVEVARTSGVPDAPLGAYAAKRKEDPPLIDGYRPPDRDLVEGVEVSTDLGAWSVHHTPGHCPSHVCLFQADRRILISGDHLLGRVSLYYDFGFSPDPVGEFLRSLDTVERLDARLCLAGHGRTFTDVQGHVDANRRLVHERLEKVAFVAARMPLTAFDIAPQVFGVPVDETNAGWLLRETLCYLTHLEGLGRVERVDDGQGHDRWSARP